jgi:CRISPR-associated protein Csd1
VILQALADYYKRQRQAPDSDIAPPGWIRRPVDYVFVLDAEGQCTQIEQRFQSVRSRRLGQSRLLPAIGKQARKHNNSGQDANLLWDNASFVLGRGNRGKTKLESFVTAIDHWFSGTDDEALRRVRAFLRFALADSGAIDTMLHSHHVAEDFDERDPLLVFRSSADVVELVHERSAVRSAYEARLHEASGEVARGRCLVSGVDNAPLASNETVITGIRNAQSSGANVVSFNKPAFVSYGKEGRNAENAPISLESSFAYSTALNSLLANERQRVQVGDASTVFWADRGCAFEDLFAGLFGAHDDPSRGTAAVRALYESLRTGMTAVGEHDVVFFVLGLAAPSKARVSIRFWLRVPLGELAPRIAQHFHDLEIVRAESESSHGQFTANDLLAASGSPTQRPGDDTVYSHPHRRHVRVARSLGGQLMQSILQGRPYPSGLLGDVVGRIRAEASGKGADGRRSDHISSVRAAVIRATLNRRIRLNRSSSKEFSVAVDRTHPDTFYRLGRLFATYEQIQRASADREMNRTIRDSYFGAAMTSPRGVIPRLARLAETHLRDIARDKPGLAAFFEREIYEIVSGVPIQSFAPAMARLEEQARFALGYYHQRHLPKKADAEPTTTQEA